MENDKLTNALIDVRKAYRLVFEFQKRILNMLSFLQNATDLEYAGGWARFSGQSPKEGKGTLENSPWDWLNMYLYEFNFTPLKEKTYFSILLVADDGYYLNIDDVELDKTNTFMKEEKSHSYFVYMCGYEESWKQNDITENGQLLKENELLELEIKNQFVAKKYFLEELKDEGSLINSIKDFNNLCSNNNLPIIKINKNFSGIE